MKQLSMTLTDCTHSFKDAHILGIRFPGGRERDYFEAIFEADFTRTEVANMLEAIARGIRQGLQTVE